MDAEIPIDDKLTMDGDELKGKGSSEFGGISQKWAIKGQWQKGEK